MVFSWEGTPCDFPQTFDALFMEALLNWSLELYELWNRIISKTVALHFQLLFFYNSRCKTTPQSAGAKAHWHNVRLIVSLLGLILVWYKISNLNFDQECDWLMFIMKMLRLFFIRSIWFSAGDIVVGAWCRDIVMASYTNIQNDENDGMIRILNTLFWIFKLVIMVNSQPTQTSTPAFSQ